MKSGKILLLPLVCVFLLSCNLDGWGWLWSSDVDDRYHDDRSLPVPAGPGSLTPPYSFVVIADTHVFSGWDTAARFTALQAAVAAAGDSFVLVCGDLVQNGARADYETFAAQAGGLGVPVYCAVGNHDLYNGGWENYRDIVGNSMYSFTAGTGAGSLRVIAIDSANGTLGAPQRAWLEDELRSRTETLCVTFTHMQFFSEGITESQQWTDITETYSLMHLLEKRGVNLHLAGHTHSYLARTINGTAYVTAPDLAGGALRVTVNAGSIQWVKIDF